MPPRRTFLLLPLLVACGGKEPAYVPPGPIGFGYLIPLPLNVATVEVADGAPLPPLGDIGHRLPTSPAEAVRIIGRDRVLAVGTEGKAVFSVLQAALIQGRETLSCQLGCRLELLSPMGSRLGLVEAQSRRNVTGPDANRPQAEEALLRRTLDDLNVEFEFQVRRSLRDWLSTTSPNPDGTMPAPALAPVERETLEPT